MRLQQAQTRTAQLVDELLQVWEASVKATHDFLPPEAVSTLRPLVRSGLAEVPLLYYAKNAAGRPAGFMGIAERKLEMLFIAPEHTGQGLGRMFVQCALAEAGVNQVDVNEQNTAAKGFYEHLGFRVFERSALDDQGNPFPILRLRLPAAYDRTTRAGALKR